MFKDRTEAGKKLAEKLKAELPAEKLLTALVLSIPRGGVIVGGEISCILNLPLDCLITKKIPAPQSEELAIGAVAETGVVVWEEELCQRLNVSFEYKKDIVKKKLIELEQKQQDFKSKASPLQLKDKVVIITDDGVATGATIKAAIAVVRNFSPKEIIVAAPVVARDALEAIKQLVDEFVYLDAPEVFFSLDQFYENFEEVDDKKVVGTLKK